MKRRITTGHRVQVPADMELIDRHFGWSAYVQPASPNEWRNVRLIRDPTVAAQKHSYWSAWSLVECRLARTSDVGILIEREPERLLWLREVCAAHFARAWQCMDVWTSVHSGAEADR